MTTALFVSLIPGVQVLRYLILAAALVTAVTLRFRKSSNPWCDTDPERHGFT